MIYRTRRITRTRDGFHRYGVWIGRLSAIRRLIDSELSR